MTRTHLKHYRVYVDGYDLSGYARSLGAMGVTMDTSPDSALSDAVKNIIPGQATITPPPINAFLDNDAAGMFAATSAGYGTRNLLVAIGALAAPVQGDLIFAGKFEQTSYNAEPSEGFSGANLVLADTSSQGVLSYIKPFGVLLHAKGAETAVNTAVGVDDNGAQTTAGGVFFYQLFSSDGTVTLKLQDASTNSDGSFGDLSGATSGSITAAVTPAAGAVALSTSATVKRYLRWQLSFGSATTATFALAFVRG